MKAIVNGKIVTITNGIIENGAILIEDGKIKAVGADIAIPQGCEVIDAKGGWVTPGLIDCHTHLCGFFGRNTMPGDSDGNEVTDPITPQLRAIDYVNPDDIAVGITRDAGFTTCYTLPGSANLIGGVGVAIKLRGRTAEEMAIDGTQQMKFALGENPKRVYGGHSKAPKTRMASAAMVREVLTKAREYADKQDSHAKGEKGDKPAFDAKLEALVPVVRGQMRCRMHAHRSDDIMTHVRTAEEFGLDFVIEHATEGWKIPDILAKRNVGCVIGPVLTGYSKAELWDATLANAGILDKAGVNVCLTADDSTNTRYLPIHVGMLIREGMDEKSAFEAVTIRPAKLLGLDSRMGSIEPGKDADIAVWDGHPFSNMTTCKAVFIDGTQYKNTL